MSGETGWVAAGKKPGRKLDDAKERDVKVLDEKEFLELIGD